MLTLYSRSYELLKNKIFDLCESSNSMAFYKPIYYTKHYKMCSLTLFTEPTIFHTDKESLLYGDKIQFFGNVISIALIKKTKMCIYKALTFK